MKFKNYIETESGIKDTSTSPGTAGQLLSSTVAGTSWIDQNTISSGTSEVVDIQVKNISSPNGGINLSKGDPVYIYGSVGASARLYVDLADADSTATNNLGDSKMPCVALLDQDLAPNIEGTATVVGKLRNLITSPIDGSVPSENDTVYVKSGGGLTLTKPTGSTNLIQNVGQVGRVSTSSSGNIVVAALLRTNDVPNLPEGRLFVGTSANTSLASDVIYVDDTSDRVGIGTANPSTDLEVSSTGVNGVDISQSASNASQSGRLFFTTNTASEGFALFNSNGTFQVNSGGIPNNTSGTNRISIIGSSGNVGIGTTNPGTYKLAVAGSTAIGGNVEVSDGLAGEKVLTLTANTGSFKIGDIDGLGNEAYIEGDSSSIKVFTGGGETLVCDSNQRVGINTTDPKTKLHVASANGGDTPTAGTATGGLFVSNTNKTYGINMGVAGAGWSFIQSQRADGNTTLYNLNLQPLGGNVGIGTINPNQKLTIKGTDQYVAAEQTNYVWGNTNTIGVRMGTDATAGLLDFRRWTGTSTTHGTALITQVNSDGGYGLDFRVDTKSSNTVATTSRIFLSQSGEVGIGTTSPNAKLEVAGSTRITGSGLDVGYGNNGTNYVQVGYGRTTNGYAYIDLIGDSTHSDYGLRILRNNTGPNADTDILHRGTGDLDFKTVEAGDIGFFTASTQKMIVKSSGNVGINTTNPSYKLQVTGGQGDTLFFQVDEDEDAYLQIKPDAATTFKIGDINGRTSQMEITGDATTLKFNGSGTNIMTITDDELVGIGTDNPSELLHLSSTGPARLLIEADTDNVTETDNAQIILKQDGGAVVGRLGYRTNTNDLELLNEYSSNIYLGTSNSIRATLHANGNFGIGNSSPQAKLHVSNGLLRTWTPSSGTSAIFESTVSNRNFVTLTAANEAELWFGDATTQTKGRIRYEMAGNNMEFWTNASQKMVINGSGNVGINTTNPTQGKLQITVPDYTNGCGITGPGNGSLSWSYMSFYAGTSFRGNILPTSTGVNYSSASDYRLKENVTKLQNSTERVKKLKPSNFNFLENPSETVDGFIAHEVQEVVPEAVTGEKDAVGRDGRPKYQGIDQSKIVPLLTAALQDAISKIEQLETRIQKLENK